MKEMKNATEGTGEIGQIEAIYEMQSCLGKSKRIPREETKKKA